jgi:hypothetical protein
MFIGFGAMLHAEDWVSGTAYFNVRFESTLVNQWSERFELYGGDSLLLDKWPFLFELGQYEIKDSVVCESHSDSVLQVTWSFRVGPRHHGGIGIARIVNMPFEIVDTFWAITPEFVLANYGPAPDSGWAFVLFGDTGQDRVVYSESTRFRLSPGESMDVVSPAFRFREVGPHYGTCGWNTDGDDADSLSWRFVVRILPHVDITVRMLTGMPLDTIDTLTTREPRVALINYGPDRDSLWLVLRFSDTLSDRIVYVDSQHVFMFGGAQLIVSFRPIRFTVPGPYHGQLAWHCMHGFGDTLDWDFWVDANLGVEDRPVAVLSKAPPTFVRGVLVLGAVDSRQNTGYRADRGDCHYVDCTRGPTLLDASGRNVMELVPGPNDVSRLAPGVYFVRQGAGVHKVVITR